VVFVPNRLADRWRRTHPIVFSVYELLASAAMVALLWVVVGRTVGLVAAGFFAALDLVLLAVAVVRLREIRRAALR
jgi:hypothetical protein